MRLIPVLQATLYRPARAPAPLLDPISKGSHYRRLTGRQCELAIGIGEQYNCPRDLCRQRPRMFATRRRPLQASTLQRPNELPLKCKCRPLPLCPGSNRSCPGRRNVDRGYRDFTEAKCPVGTSRLHRLGYSLWNPSVSRTDPPREKESLGMEMRIESCFLDRHRSRFT